jgi:preprotein translocase subunit Sec61beta
MAVVEQQVNALELERVLPKIRVLFERDDKFYATIAKRDVEKISQRQMRIPLEIKEGSAFQYFNADGGDLGRGSGPTWDKAVLNCVFVSQNTEYTKLTEWATNADRKAITNAVRRLTARALTELRRQLDAQLMQSGNGVLGTVTTDTPAGGSNVITLTTDGFGARLMRPGQTVQVFDSTLATLKGSGVISFWDVENKTIQITPQIAGVGVGDLVVVNGISSPNSLPAIFGVPYHHSNASTGTWLGFNRATTPEIRSNRVNAASNALTLPLPRLAINKIGNRVGIDNNFSPEAWMHPAQKQAYEEIGQLVSVIQRPENSKEGSLDLYFDKMQMAGAPVKVSFNWNQTRIDFINHEVWGRGEILPLGFYRTDGRNIFEIRGASGGVATADIFYMVNGVQFFVSNPAATSYIDALAVPAGY